MAGSDSLTAARLRELLHYDPETGVSVWRQDRHGGAKAGDIAGTLSQGYIQIRIDGSVTYAHRIAWVFAYGVWPPDEIDQRQRRPE